MSGGPPQDISCSMTYVCLQFYESMELNGRLGSYKTPKDKVLMGKGLIFKWLDQRGERDRIQWECHPPSPVRCPRNTLHQAGKLARMLSDVGTD